jgi:voltage-gated potassium channel
MDPKMPTANVPPAGGANPAPNAEGRSRWSMASFLAALIVLLVTVPFVLELEHGELVESALMTVVMLAAVPAVGGRRRTLLLAFALVAPAIVSNWLWQTRPDLLPRVASLGSALVFLIFVIVHLLRFIVTAPRVNSEVLCAAIATYLMMGVFWALAYTLVGELNSQAFKFTAEPNRPLKGFESLYFSFVTLTTVGYGDIVPVANMARLLAMLESTVGTFYVAVLVARLVSAYAVDSTPVAPPPAGVAVENSR